MIKNFLVLGLAILSIVAIHFAARQIMTIPTLTSGTQTSSSKSVTPGHVTEIEFDVFYCDLQPAVLCGSGSNDVIDL